MATEHFSSLKKHFGSRFVSALEGQTGNLDFCDYLTLPEHQSQKRLAVTTEANGRQFFSAWRIRYQNMFGPSKGGVRFHESVSADSLATLAARILVKCAANGLPHGGAAGGVCVNPKQLSGPEQRQLAERYIEAYAAEIGADKDILSPDLGTSATTMAWMSTCLNKQLGRFELGAINGKPLPFGGIRGRHRSTAAGACLVLRKLLSVRGRGLEGMRVAIQGFGAAGATLAQELSQAGVRLIAVSDSSGGWYSPNGLDTVTLVSGKSKGLSLKSLDLKNASPINSDAVLEADVDLVVAAALGGQICLENANRLKCDYVVEIANAAVTDEAEDILIKKGIEIVPDLIVNAGGITVSHFEWVQNRNGSEWSEEEVVKMLLYRMGHTTDLWLQRAIDHKVSLTIAAQLIAIERIRSALEL